MWVIIGIILAVLAGAGVAVGPDIARRQRDKAAIAAGDDEMPQTAAAVQKKPDVSANAESGKKDAPESAADTKESPKAPEDPSPPDPAPREKTSPAADKPVEGPVDKPAEREKPAETPVARPKEQPAETPASGKDAASILRDRVEQAVSRNKEAYASVLFNGQKVRAQIKEIKDGRLRVSIFSLGGLETAMPWTAVDDAALASCAQPVLAASDGEALLALLTVAHAKKQDELARDAFDKIQRLADERLTARARAALAGGQPGEVQTSPPAAQKQPGKQDEPPGVSSTTVSAPTTAPTPSGGKQPWVHAFTPRRTRTASSFGEAISGAQAGDLVWLGDGHSKGYFTTACQGTKDAPIVIRVRPGAHHVIEGTIHVESPYVWIWGFEIIDPAFKDHLIQAYSSGVHIINNVMHNSGGGIGGWNNGPDHVYYGNLIYGLGGDVNPPNRRTNYPTYTQNELAKSGNKYFVQNMFFDGRPYGGKYNFHGYTQEGYVQGFQVIHNVFARGRFLLGSNKYNGHHGLVLENLMYDCEEARLGWSGPMQCEFRGNYLARTPFHWSGFWGGSGNPPLPNIFTGNEIYVDKGNHITDFTLVNAPGPKDVWNDNTYSRGYRKDSGLPGNFEPSPKIVPMPAQPKVFAWPNEYEPGRGHLAIVNWGKAQSVSVDLSPIVAKGAAFTVHVYKDAFGKPAASGTLSGPVEIPMGGEEFQAFLVRTKQ
jgi:hypothetical protein